MEEEEKVVESSTNTTTKRNRAGRPSVLEYYKTPDGKPPVLICKECNRDFTDLPNITRKFSVKLQTCYYCKRKEWWQNYYNKIPKRLCKCGCGTVIPIRTRRNTPKEYVHRHKPLSERMKQIKARQKQQRSDRYNVFYGGANRTGKMPSVTGMPGVIMSKDGYISIRIPDHPRASKQGLVPAAVLMMEDHIGRYLYPWEYIEHKNNISRDNRISNLILRVSYTTKIYNRVDGGYFKDDKGNYKLRCAVTYKEDPDLTERKGVDMCREIVWGNDAAIDHLRKVHGMFLQ